MRGSVKGGVSGAREGSGLASDSMHGKEVECPHLGNGGGTRVEAPGRGQGLVQGRALVLYLPPSIPAPVPVPVRAHTVASAHLRQPFKRKSPAPFLQSQLITHVIPRYAPQGASQIHSLY